MTVVDLATSPFLGGPERHMLGLALAMPLDRRKVFLLLPDSCRSQAFRTVLEETGLETQMLKYNAQRVPAMVTEIARTRTAHGASRLEGQGLSMPL